MQSFPQGNFSPTSELREVQFQPAQAQASSPVPSDDFGRRLDHLQDKMEIMNEKLDMILREIRNIYETGAGRRV